MHGGQREGVAQQPGEPQFQQVSGLSGIDDACAQRFQRVLEV